MAFLCNGARTLTRALALDPGPQRRLLPGPYRLSDSTSLPAFIEPLWAGFSFGACRQVCDHEYPFV